MKKTIDMPEIMSCTMTKCAYNRSLVCHARAITVGDTRTPDCDTFFSNDKHCKSEMIAGVGACKVSACTHNQDYECQAPSISMGSSSKTACCLTYEQS